MYLGVDIGGTKTRLARFAEDETIQEMVEFPTAQDFEQFKTELIEQIKKLIGSGSPKAIGVGAPGTIDYENMILISCGNLPWEHVDIKGTLETEFSVPVALDNDANVAAVGESALGAGKGYKTVLYVTLSTGIGTGVAVDDQVPGVIAKIEGGRTVMMHNGQLMLWEQFASGKAFFEQYGKKGEDVDDPAVWKEYCTVLAPGLYNLLLIVSPDVVVIGGGMGHNLPKFETELNDQLSSIYSKFMPLLKIPDIKVAHDAENAVIHGCYVEAKRVASSS